jgi:hypothetical protein
MIVDGKNPDHPGVLCGGHDVIPVEGMSIHYCRAKN